MSVDDVGEGLEAAPKLLMLFESIFLSFGRFFRLVVASGGGGRWPEFRLLKAKEEKGEGW